MSRRLLEKEIIRISKIINRGLLVLALLYFSPAMQLSFSDGYNMNLLSHLGGQTYCVDVSQNYLYTDIGMDFVIYDITDKTKPILKSQLQFNYLIADIKVRGNYAYIANQYNGLQIIDISNPASPQVVGSYKTQSSAWNVALSGDFAYVPMGNSLYIINISNPSAPTLAATYNIGNSCYDIAINGSYVYLTIGGFEGTIQIVDVSNPSSPILYNTIQNLNCPNKIKINGNIAFLVTNSGLTVIDITNPQSPQILTKYLELITINNIYAIGNLLYILTTGGYIYVFDITDPNLPEQKGAYLCEYSGTEMVVKDDTLYLASYFWGFQFLDVADPANISVLYKQTTIGQAKDVFINNNITYLVNGIDGLTTLDISNPNNPQILGSYDVPGSAKKVVVDNNKAYIADDQYGLEIIDVSNPSSPFLLGEYKYYNYGISSVAVQNNKAYIIYPGINVFAILDVTVPTTPTLMGTFTFQGINENNFNDIEVKDNIAIVAGNTNVYLIDVYYPFSPFLLAQYQNIYANSIFINGNYAFLGNGTTIGGGNLKILNISNPCSPFLVGMYQTKHLVNDVFVKDRLAYLASSYSGILVLDVANPAAPTLFTSYDTVGQAAGIKEKDGIVYLADQYGGFQIFDIPTPPPTPTPTPSPSATPSVTPTVTPTPTIPPAPTPAYKENFELVNAIGGTCYGFDIQGNIAYIGEGIYFTVLDISDKANPVILARLKTEDLVYKIAVQGNYAYMANCRKGIKVIDISNPSNPQIVNSLYFNGRIQNLCVSGNFLYIVYYFYIYIYDITNPAEPICIKRYKDSSSYNIGKIVVKNGLLYINKGLSFDIYDVSDPLNPQRLGGYLYYPKYEYNEQFLLSDTFFVNDTTAYCLMNGFLFILDIRYPTKVIRLSRTSISNTANFGYGSVFVEGNIAYIADTVSKILLYDISNPQYPKYLTSIKYDRLCYTLNGNNENLFLGGTNGFFIYDIANKKSKISLDGQFFNYGNAYSLQVENSNLFSFSRETTIPNYFNIFDISNPLSAYLLSYNPYPNKFIDYYSENKNLFILKSDLLIPGYYLDTFDVSDPKNVVNKYSELMEGNPYKVYAKDNYAYIFETGGDSSILKIYDVSNDTTMTLLSEYISSSSLKAIAVKDSIAYISDMSPAINIFDVSNPTLPTLITSIPTTDTASIMIINNSKLYTATNKFLVIYDISNPYNLSLLSLTEFSNSLNQIDISGNILYYINSFDLNAVDISDPYNPVRVGFHRSITNNYDVAAFGDYVYVASDSGGIQLFRFGGNPVNKESWDEKNNWDCYTNTGGTASNDIAEWKNNSLICKWSSYPLPAPGFFQWLKTSSQGGGVDANILYQPDSLYILRAKMSSDSEDTIPIIRLRAQSADNVFSACGLYGVFDYTKQCGAPGTTPSDFYLLWEPQGSSSNMFAAIDIFSGNENTGEISVHEMDVYRIPMPTVEREEGEITYFTNWGAIGNNVTINLNNITIADTDTWSAAGGYINLINPISKNSIYRLKYLLNKEEIPVRASEGTIVDQFRLRTADTYNGAYSSNFMFNDSIAASKKLSTEPKEYSHYHWAMNVSSAEPMGDLTVFLDTINSTPDSSGITLTKIIIEKITTPSLIK